MIDPTSPLGDTLRQLAAAIVTDLFTNGVQQEAHRLVLTDYGGRDLGGWGRQAAEDRVRRILTERLESAALVRAVPLGAAQEERKWACGASASGSTPLPTACPVHGPTCDLVCQHGTAMDVHCCGCHSGFLFDASACSCLHPKDDTMTLSLHRCTICGTRWLLWPAGIGGTKDASWNLLDSHQRPGSCCDNVAMGDQIEHLRDIPLALPPVPVEPAAPPELFLRRLRLGDSIVCSDGCSEMEIAQARACDRLLNIDGLGYIYRPRVRQPRCIVTTQSETDENPHQCIQPRAHDGEHEFDALMVLNGPIQHLPYVPVVEPAAQTRPRGRAHARTG